MIYLRGIEKTFQDGKSQRVLFQDLDFTVESAQKVAITGASGSGKTTLLYLLSGLEQPQKGTIQIGSLEMTQLSEKERTLFRRKSVGFVFQSFHLIEYLSVQDNILVPLELNQMELKQDHFLSLVQTLKLQNLLYRYPTTLSGGEKQRVAIARSLIHQPSFVLADEPTGSLDAKTAEETLEMLQNVARLFQQTLIIVTHSPKTLDYVDTVFHLEDQKLKQTQSL